MGIRSLLRKFCIAREKRCKTELERINKQRDSCCKCQSSVHVCDCEINLSNTINCNCGKKICDVCYDDHLRYSPTHYTCDNICQDPNHIVYVLNKTRKCKCGKYLCMFCMIYHYHN